MENKPSLWHLYTVAPHYNRGKYLPKIKEITFRDGYYYRKRNNINSFEKLTTIKEAPGGYVLSILFDDYNSTIEYKKYMEEKYYNEINKLLDDTNERIEFLDKKMEDIEFVNGTKYTLRKQKLDKLDALFNR